MMRGRLLGDTFGFEFTRISISEKCCSFRESMGRVKNNAPPGPCGKVFYHLPLVDRLKESVRTVIQLKGFSRFVFSIGLVELLVISLKCKRPNKRLRPC